MARYDVPEDVLIDILLCLPVMSLLRFKCVCKSWCSLIQSSTFIAQHLNNGNGALLVKRRLHVEDKYDFLLLSDETFEVRANLEAPPSFNGLNKKEQIEMLASCNGIICLYDKSKGNRLALWNPATREVKALPESRVPLPAGTKFGHREVGFGFDHKTNDYKVVRIVNLEHKKYYPYWPKNQVEVYSLNTDSWRRIDAVMPAPCLWPNNRPRTYLNGIYSWWAGNGFNEETLVSFDMSNEMFLRTKLPASCTASFYDGYWKSFTALNGSIALIFLPIGEDCKDRCIEIWVLNEYGIEGSWTKIYTIGPFPVFFWPLGFSKNGELFLEDTKPWSQEETDAQRKLWLTLPLKHQLFLCDPVTQEIKNLHVDGINRSFEVIAYKQSLVSLNGGNGHAKRNLSLTKLGALSNKFFFKFDCIFCLCEHAKS